MTRDGGEGSENQGDRDADRDSDADSPDRVADGTDHADDADGPDHDEGDDRYDPENPGERDPGDLDGDEERHDPDEEMDDLDEEELDDLIEDLEDLEETADTDEERRILRRTRRTLHAVAGGRIFGLDDLAQQVVGGVLLSAPFVVTAEVWSLAASMGGLQWAVTVLVVLVVGYGALYRADRDRDPEREESVAGLPLRFVSLVAVSYLSVVLVAFVFDAPDAFDATPRTTAKAVCIGAVFSVVGAATADSLFE